MLVASLCLVLQLAAAFAASHLALLSSYLELGHGAPRGGMKAVGAAPVSPTPSGRTRLVAAATARGSSTRAGGARAWVASAAQRRWLPSRWRPARRARLGFSSALSVAAAAQPADWLGGEGGTALAPPPENGSQ